MTERNQRKQQERQLAHYKPSPYSRALSTYLRRDSSKVEPLLRSLARRSPLAPLLPIPHILRAVARLFLLNILEALLAGWALEQCNWDLQTPGLELSHSMGQLVPCPTQRPEHPRTVLLVLLASWWAKQALNSDPLYLLEEAKKVCPRFI